MYYNIDKRALKPSNRCTICNPIFVPAIKKSKTLIQPFIAAVCNAVVLSVHSTLISTPKNRNSKINDKPLVIFAYFCAYCCICIPDCRSSIWAISRYPFLTAQYNGVSSCAVLMRFTLMPKFSVRRKILSI